MSDQVENTEDRFSHNEAQFRFSIKSHDSVYNGTKECAGQNGKMHRLICVVVACIGLKHMSLVVRKPVFGVSDLVRHKPGCKLQEMARGLKFRDVGSRGIVLYM